MGNIIIHIAKDFKTDPNSDKDINIFLTNYLLPACQKIKGNLKDKIFIDASGLEYSLSSRFIDNTFGKLVELTQNTHLHKRFKFLCSDEPLLCGEMLEALKK